MEKLFEKLRSEAFFRALWVALCFGLVSLVYLSWVDRLVQLGGGQAADWLSMVAGYLFQAAGMAGSVFLLRRDAGTNFRRIFFVLVLLFSAFAAPAVLSSSFVGAVCFGFIMNLLCGGITGFYLYALSQGIDPARRALVFGGGYALSTIAVGLLSLIGSGRFLHSGYGLLVSFAMAAAALALTPRLFADNEKKAPLRPETPAEPVLLLAGIVVVLTSLVKNMGFSFPSADIEAGLIPELSRLPYAAGLAAAGFITDKSRKNGMLCTAAALILPFIMLGIAGEPVPSAICWGLDYLFFGFFSVFRVVLFLDIADRTGKYWLAPFGLLLGRAGDAAGTGASILMAEHKLLLIAVTVILFFPTVFLFVRLYRRLYETKAPRQRSEQEVFEAFCIRNDLSAREREVLRMVIDNFANGEIAESLFITESTVKYHVRNVLQKTGCKNRTELQRKYTMALYPLLDFEESRTG